MSDDLTRAMRATAENLTPNIGKLTAGAVERGIRKRRVRRLSQIGGAAASVTAVFGVVAAVGTGGSGPAPVNAGAGGAVAAAAAPAATTPAAAPTTPLSTPEKTGAGAYTPPNAPAAPPVSGEDMVKWFTQELTAAQANFSDQKVQNKSGSDKMGGPFAVLTVGYPAGQGSVSVTVENTAWRSVHYGSPLPAGTTISNLPDGSHLVVYNGLQWPAGNGDPSAKRLDATWYRIDGTSVTVEALNEVHEKEATTATAVPLTVAQVSKIATSPVWDKAAKAAAYQATLNYQKAIGDKNGPAAGGVPSTTKG